MLVITSPGAPFQKGWFVCCYRRILLAHNLASSIPKSGFRLAHRCLLTVDVKLIHRIARDLR